MAYELKHRRGSSHAIAALCGSAPRARLTSAVTPAASSATFTRPPRQPPRRAPRPGRRRRGPRGRPRRRPRRHGGVRRFAPRESGLMQGRARRHAACTRRPFRVRAPGQEPAPCASASGAPGTTSSHGPRLVSLAAFSRSPRLVASGYIRPILVSSRAMARCRRGRPRPHRRRRRLHAPHLSRSRPVPSPASVHGSRPQDAAPGRAGTSPARRASPSRPTGLDRAPRATFTTKGARGTARDYFSPGPARERRAARRVTRAIRFPSPRRASGPSLAPSRNDAEAPPSTTASATASRSPHELTSKVNESSSKAHELRLYVTDPEARRAEHRRGVARRHERAVVRGSIARLSNSALGAA